MRRIFLTLILFCISLGSLWAQRTGIISGKLMDGTNGQPMAFANIYLEGTTLGTVSDVRGTFRLVSVPAGEHVVVCSVSWALPSNGSR